MLKNQLQNFVIVADCGSINKASEKLFISQPNLSRSIHLLEKEMGRDLFIRTNKGVVLTPFGKQLYYYAQSILNKYQMIEHLKNGKTNRVLSQLNISVHGLYIKDDMLLQFYNQSTADDIDICFYEVSAEDVLDFIVQGKTEAGILVLNDHQYPLFLKKAKAEGVIVHRIDRAPIFVHVNEKHPLANNENVKMEDLINYPVIRVQNDFYGNLNYSLSIRGLTLNSIKKHITCNNYHSIIRLLKGTDAFMFGNKWQIDELKNSKLRSIRYIEEDIQQNFLIIYREKGVFTESTKRFLTTLCSTLQLQLDI